MWCPETLALINMVAYQLIREGKPQRDALGLVIDPRKRKELDRVLAAAKAGCKTT